MVESADEPPLRGFHSWAKTSLPPRKHNEKESKISDLPSISGFSKQPDPDNKILPQDAGDTGTAPERKIPTEVSSSNLENTQPQSTFAVDQEGAGTQPSPISHGQAKTTKAPIHQRLIRDVKRVITASWINWLLVFVPAGIILGAIEDWGGVHVVSPTVIFAINAVAIIPLASLLAYATESVALKMGDQWGALLNVTFGNAVEIIVFVIGLIANEVRVVQAAAVGSILSNLLLILGMSFLLGGLRFREQVYNKAVSQMSAVLLCLSVISLLLPTAFHATFADDALANKVVLKVSRGTSVVLLLVYVLYLLFQLKSHAFMYASTPQHVIDEESHPGVLAQMLDSSSSSSSDSSSTESDSTAGSHKTANRFKRALRRKRRKSSSSTKDEASVTLPRSDNNADPLVDMPRIADDAVVSGDEADSETTRRGRIAIQAVQTRDFETESRHEKRKRRRKRKDKARPRSGKEPESIEMREKVAERAVPNNQSGISGHVQGIPDNGMARPHHHARNLSSAIKPVLNSSNFPHHEAMTRSLAPPALRTQDRTVPSGSMRRASSMPDIHRQSSPFARTASPGPLGQPIAPDGQVQVVETVETHEHLSTTSAVVMLLITTTLVALCAEFLVGSISYLVANSGVSQAFIGLIILPLVGNAAEHVTAVTVAYKNKMDLSINIALGSSIQIALFVTPLMVMLGWAIGAEMSLYFSLFETMSLFASAFIANYLMIDGRSNWLEGTLLIAGYVIIAIGAFFIPTCGLSDTSGMVKTPQTC